MRTGQDLPNRHSCLTSAINKGTDIDKAEPIAEGMINQQTIFEGFRACMNQISRLISFFRPQLKRVVINEYIIYDMITIYSVCHAIN